MITIEDIGRACAAAVVEKERLVKHTVLLAAKLRKLNLMLARETRVHASIDLYTDWEKPELAMDAIAQAKKQLARELADHLLARDLFVIEIDDAEFKPCRQLKAEIRVLRPLKDREVF